MFSSLKTYYFQSWFYFTDYFTDNRILILDRDLNGYSWESDMLHFFLFKWRLKGHLKFFAITFLSLWICWRKYWKEYYMKILFHSPLAYCNGLFFREICEPFRDKISDKHSYLILLYLLNVYIIQYTVHSVQNMVHFLLFLIILYIEDCTSTNQTIFIYLYIFSQKNFTNI